MLNNNRVIQLESGRLLMPVALHNVPGGEWSNKAALYCYFSDDNGETWYSVSFSVNKHNFLLTLLFIRLYYFTEFVQLVVQNFAVTHSVRIIKQNQYEGLLQ